MPPILYGVVDAAADQALAAVILEVHRQRPAFMLDAACLEHPEVTFVASVSSKSVGAFASRSAIEVCQGCLVRDACLAYALQHRIEGGVWGGLTARARTVMAGRRGARPDSLEPCAECGAAPRVRKGRYCSNTCSARAYRRRKRAA